MTVRQSQEKCSWEATKGVLDYARKSSAYADWPILLTEDSPPPAPSTEEQQQSSPDDLPASVATPMYLQSLLSRAEQ